MNVEALAMIGGGAVLIFIVVAPLAVWVARRRVSGASAGPVLSRTGLIVMSLFVALLLVGAVLAQAFHGLGRLVFVAGGLGMLILLFGQVANVLERRGYPMQRMRSERR